MIRSKRQSIIISVIVLILILVFILPKLWQRQFVTSGSLIDGDPENIPTIHDTNNKVVAPKLIPVKDQVVTDSNTLQMTDNKKEDIGPPQTMYKLPQEEVSVDAIGGFYDERAQAPESRMEQIKDIGDIGYYDPYALAPEDGYEDIPFGEGPTSISKKIKIMSNE
jgi:hypothetical protein